MIKFENIETWGFHHALRGMRNPMNSWNRSDTIFDVEGGIYQQIGPNDLDLMKRLFSAGTEHRKYLRQIFVSMDITAPLYWWKEFDTYKVGTVANSCSTMHKIMAKPFELSDFSYDEEDEAIDQIIEYLNDCREVYLESKDKRIWRKTIQLLPEAYNQRRTVTMNYENVFSMIQQRTGHKLQEWRDFVDILKGLPYVREISGDV